MPSILQDRSKLTVIVAVVLVIIVLSTVGKDLFAKVAAAPDPNGPPAETCATLEASPVGQSLSGLQSTIIAPPAGWTAVADHQAGAGAVDFSKALQAEPDTSTALSVLDSSRFQRGYSRSFAGPAGAAASVAVYQFAADVCAAQYVTAHRGDDALTQRFDVPGIASALGGVRKGTDGSSMYFVWASRADAAIIVTWQGDTSTARSVAGVVALAQAQFTALGG